METISEKKLVYESPTFRIVEVKVERGYAASGVSGGSTSNYDQGGNDGQDDNGGSFF